MFSITQTPYSTLVYWIYSQKAHLPFFKFRQFPKNSMITYRTSMYTTHYSGGSRISRRRGGVDPLRGAWTSNVGAFHRKRMQQGSRRAYGTAVHVEV